MVTDQRYRVLIMGGGQLGSRHLQGLARCRHRLEVHVVDPEDVALKLAASRWALAEGIETCHEVRFQPSIVGLPAELDVAIVATTAENRPLVVEELVNHVTIGSWVLEKVLAQSHEGLDRLCNALGHSSDVWVNTWARTTGWYETIRAAIGKGPLSVEVEGESWGMACNAVHFLDLIAWWTGEQLVSVDCSKLDPRWQPAKRPGHFEPSGELRANYASGTTALFRSTPPEIDAPAGTDPIERMTIDTATSHWVIDRPFSETDGKASDDAGNRITGHIELQSQRTGPLVDEILSTGRCDLPDLATSVAQHRRFLTGLLLAFPPLVGVDPDRVPIT
ncbi:MAG: hypothetical protein QF638_07870 [Acidimicrobiales bacterium]|nr:hypothetical protein [Acidimicrobiales bacterium]